MGKYPIGGIKIIEVDCISKSYNKKDLVIDDLSLKVNSGEIFGFLGQNGAGKTTLIRIISGILKPDKGSVKLNGISLNKKNIQAKKQFALMPDNPEIYGKIRGMDWLHFIGAVYKVLPQVLEHRIEELTEKFEIKDELYQQVDTYSLGMKHKLSLLAGLVHNPPILIFDEPLQGLDPKATYWLKNVMQEHAKKGGTVFFSTHLLDVAERICDRFAIIQDGNILTLESMQDIRDRNMNLESYFMELIS